MKRRITTSRSAERWRFVRWGATALVVATYVTLGMPRTSLGDWEWVRTDSYFIDESTDFTGNGCQNSNVNDVTSSLRGALNNDGWVGQRWANVWAWPEDMKESSYNSDWEDAIFGDNYALTVYAGHGNVDWLQYGYKRLGSCGVRPSTQMRMGRLEGGKNRIFMYLTSCTGRVGCQWSSIFKSGSGQHLAYHNSPVIYDNQPRDMYRATATTTTRLAWLYEMDNRPGSGWNSPVIYTRGRTPSTARFYHYDSKIWHENYSAMGEPYLNYYYIHYMNNGTSGSCNGCS